MLVTIKIVEHHHYNIRVWFDTPVLCIVLFYLTLISRRNTILGGHISTPLDSSIFELLCGFYLLNRMVIASVIQFLSLPHCARCISLDKFYGLANSICSVVYSLIIFRLCRLLICIGLIWLLLFFFFSRIWLLLK